MVLACTNRNNEISHITTISDIDHTLNARRKIANSNTRTATLSMNCLLSVGQMPPTTSMFTLMEVGSTQ